MAPDLERLARERFGHERLRPGQREAVEAVLGGRDTLAVMATGSGKSLVYQLAGALMEGPTVVVSPLVSLQQDQIEQVAERSELEAAELNASVGERARRELFEALDDERLEFLLLAPEQLAKPEVLAAVGEAKPSLFVVDEAHCVSEWGHDFRPAYLRLGEVIETFGHPTVLALTATASPPVREEIAERLGLRDPCVLVRGFDRPNLWLGVERFADEDRRREALLDRTEAAPKPGLVYAATRRGAEELAEALAERGVACRAYHAGLADGERDEVQAAFMDGALEVVVATIAFGMGIDKPDVRFVHHAQVSDSLDGYYQEIGRAGRDGERAEAVLFYRPEDLGLRRFFAGGHLEPDVLDRVARAVHDAGGPLGPDELCERCDLSRTRLLGAVHRLEDAGAVELRGDGRVAPAGGRDVSGAVREATEAEERRRAFDRSRVEMMRDYAEHDACRREALLAYFGEGYEPPCGCCDNCDAGHGVPEAGERPFAVGAAVRHGEWGEGRVQRYDGEEMVVLFDSVGYKTLAVPVVLERGLLTRSRAGRSRSGRRSDRP